IAWLVTALATSGSNKLESAGQPLEVRARETASGPEQSTLAGKASDSNPDKTKTVVVATNLAVAAKPVPQTMAFSDLKLQGIFFSTVHPSAIINGKMVHPMDRVADAVVLEIGPSSVTLLYQNHRKTLVLK
ncbi:MAG TPA: hypothetical protein VFC07_05185, partial [Verrucomicrobiae bacterium]|nr:hypothetical protein [Verrucomicrobiae bacterium]